ncbi:transcriptional regulator [Arthrobacter parietis]|uniref:Transcriptional regulator n=2 Tax=Arthrobacter TaxID=1663 RepID=A0ABT6CSE5_9MICC|nr:transcriptional regulator [Arthrobacter vasquezii]MDF9276954.1 transcriptional regulator [Arthrobacter vasquezii]
MTHTRHEIDPVIHSPVRFSIVAFLIGLDECEFSALRDAIELSDSSLSQHLTVLETAGHIEISKRKVGRRSRTYIRCTDGGQGAFRKNLQALATIASSNAESLSAQS